VIADGFDIITYRKGRIRRVSEKKFLVRTATLDGHSVEYLLNDQPIRFLNHPRLEVGGFCARRLKPTGGAVTVPL